MKYLFLIMLFVSSLAVGEDAYVTLRTGQVITVPEGYKTCVYHYEYCPLGWKPDGSFPAMEELPPNCGNIPICDDGLVVSPSTPVRPCWRLVKE